MYGRKIEQRNNRGFNSSKIDLTFSNQLWVTTYAFPRFNFVDYFSNIGGLLGLWLGLGIAQLFEKCIQIIWKTCNK